MVVKSTCTSSTSSVLTAEVTSSWILALRGQPSTVSATDTCTRPGPTTMPRTMFSSVIGRCSSGSCTELSTRWTSSSVITLAWDTYPPNQTKPVTSRNQFHTPNLGGSQVVFLTS